MSAFLTPDSISAQTSEHQVLFSDLTLSVGAERVGLVGRNGSGKSTLIRIIAGMAEPAAGAVQRMGAIAVLAQDWPEDLTPSLPRYADLLLRSLFVQDSVRRGDNLVVSPS
jgi:ATPase subunit of ABC transporter with duplicated ATPase domains